jgi:hypothetical protein
MGSAAIAFAEGMPVVVNELTLYPRMLVPVMIVGVVVGMGVKVVASGFHAIVESQASSVTIFRRRLIPAALSFILSRGSGRCGIGPRRDTS